MSDLLLQAMNARQNGNVALTKQLLAQALIQDPRNEGAWMLMYEVVDDVKLKRNCLERVLAINPDNSAAEIALMKLDTSPLGPVLRGERYKSITPSKPGITAPFTPPFTWTGDESQFQALGDMTFPDLTGENTNPPPETPTTFDWASESGEPDKTINKIFDAVSNPELASQPLQDTDLSWLDKVPADGQLVKPHDLEQDNHSSLGEKPPETITDTSLQQPIAEPADFSVSPLPEWGVKAFASEDIKTEPTEADSLLWDNPKASVDRMVILGNQSIIYANPSPSDIPHILGLFNDKKMLRDLLGQNAGVIKLDSIRRLTAFPKRSNLVINFKQNEKLSTHQLIFKNRKERDEALSAVQLRLGADFIRHTHHFDFLDKILSPLLCFLVVVFLGWLLIFGLPQFALLSAFQTGTLQLIMVNLQSYVDLIGAVNVLVIALILVVLCLIWLVVNVSKPSQQIIVERLRQK